MSKAAEANAEAVDAPFGLPPLAPVEQAAAAGAAPPRRAHSPPHFEGRTEQRSALGNGVRNCGQPRTTDIERNRCLEAERPAELAPAAE
jgi:hypothetical protein